jgi:glyoxylase-like metal-dependent hydrolase (beta-lactamase superfamily II)
MRRIAKGLGWIVLAILVTLGGFLAEAHWEIRRISPALPDRRALAAKLDVAGGPVSIHFVNTATQRSKPGRGTIGHPSFRLEWPDGRVFLIDVGMDAAGAEAFGRGMELLLGSDPIEPHGSLAQQLDETVGDVQGIAFTHLHSDHTQGLTALCEALGRGVDVFQNPWQSVRGNYTTSPGRNDLESAGCARTAALGAGPVFALPGFPGLVAVAAGGHTPGSTVYFARVGDLIWVLAGDISNFRDALLENRPKPRAYSLLVTPEAPIQLESLRRGLAEFNALPEFTVLVSHDIDAIVASGMPAWTADE